VVASQNGWLLVVRMTAVRPRARTVRSYRLVSWWTRTAFLGGVHGGDLDLADRGHDEGDGDSGLGHLTGHLLGVGRRSDDHPRYHARRPSPPGP
jgi:hypothetical protein